MELFCWTAISAKNLDVVGDIPEAEQRQARALRSQKRRAVGRVIMSANSSCQLGAIKRACWIESHSFGRQPASTRIIPGKLRVDRRSEPARDLKSVMLVSWTSSFPSVLFQS